jgi:Tfp pilus assembly protein PilO
MTPLASRIVREHQSVVLAIVASLLVNVLTYALVVQPRGVRAAGAADRAAAAARSRAAAERELAAAQALVTGKSRADEKLNAFYQDVLPAGREAARRMMDQQLPVLADQSGVRWSKRTSDVAIANDARLGQLTITMVLEGEYDELREFIYAIESATNFIIVEDVMLSEGRPNEALTLTVRMSTYFRAPHGI